MFLKEHKIWPVQGGLIDQSAKFIKTIEFVDMIKQRYDEMDQFEREAKERLSRLNNATQ